MVADIANSTGDTLLYDYHLPGGYTLNDHYSDSVSKNKIISGGWDYIIMQEQSQLPSFDFYYSSGLVSLCSLIQVYNPCARKMLYMTWGRKNGDALNCPVWPPSCTYAGMDSMLRLNYIETALLIESEISPVGVVWRYIRENFPSIELYQPDESHPSMAGSYAAACSFYTSIFKKDPSASTYSPLLDTMAETLIRDAAKRMVYDSLPLWDFGQYYPDVHFEYNIGNGQNEIILQNNSIHADYFLWEFGDGDTSSAKNPTHNFQSNGTFTILLHAGNCDLNTISLSSFDTTVSFCNHNPLIIPDSLVLCPNTYDTLWTQNYDTYQWYDSDLNALAGETNQFIVVNSFRELSVHTSVNGCFEMSPPVIVQQFASGFVFYWVDVTGNFTSPDSVCKTDSVLLVLRSNKPAGSDFIYQWFESGMAIPAATHDTLVLTASGNYSVEVRHTDCPDYIYFHSGNLPFTFIDCNIDVEEIGRENLIIIFPNPARGLINAKFNSVISADFTLIDISGRKIKGGVLFPGNNSISIDGVDKGIYLMAVNGLQYGCYRIFVE